MCRVGASGAANEGSTFVCGYVSTPDPPQIIAHCASEYHLPMRPPLVPSGQRNTSLFLMDRVRCTSTSLAAASTDFDSLATIIALYVAEWTVHRLKAPRHPHASPPIVKLLATRAQLVSLLLCIPPNASASLACPKPCTNTNQSVPCRTAEPTTHSPRAQVKPPIAICLNRRQRIGG